MRFPDFLIIGAMKAGTTTLFFDLLQNSRVYMPDNKEPHSLVNDEVLTEAGRIAYASHFKDAAINQTCGEGSTGYTKMPQYSGVARRALELCGPDLRLLYIMRDPIDRIVSHHYHAFTYGNAGPSIDEEVKTREHFLAFSQYAMQLRPWLDAFDRSNLHLVRFDRYMSARQQGAQEAADFLGVGSTQGAVEEEKVYNKGDRRPVHRGVLSVIYHSAAYRGVLRPLVPRGLRQWAFETFFPRGPERPPLPSNDTIRWIVDHLSSDLDQLARIAGDRCEVWTPEGLLAKHLRSSAPSPEHSEVGARA